MGIVLFYLKKTIGYDTEEEANMMKPYLEGKRAALVTEASHLKRASIFFEQAGINTIPAPASRSAISQLYFIA